MSGSQKAATPAEAFGGCAALILIFMIGSCVFGSSEKPKEPDAVAVSPQVNEAPTTSSPPAKSDVKALMGDDTGPVDISDLDEADRAIRLAINMSGHLCAKPILVLPTALDTKYEVTCITNRSGKGRSRYIVDSKTERVVQVR